MTNQERFKTKIVVDEATGCWNWQPKTQAFWFPSGTERANRAAWRLFRDKPLPPERILNRDCKNRQCVNPAHASIGRIAENFAGQAELKAKLKEELITEDRERLKASCFFPPETGCWIYKTAVKWGRGYGQFWLNGKTIPAHRASYILFKGPIPPGLFVLHQCDDPPCVNPDHLHLGTRADNAREAVERDRLARGEAHPHSFLKDAEVAALRGEFIPGRRGECARLARKYQLDLATVWGIVHNKSWSHVDTVLGSSPSGDPPFKAPHGNDHPNHKLTISQVKTTKAQLARGVSITVIASRFGVNVCTISDIKQGRTWRHVA